MKSEMPPGATPYMQGYYAHVWGTHKEAPNWHHGHTKIWREEWTRGYNDAKMKDNRGDGND